MTGFINRIDLRSLKMVIAIFIILSLILAFSAYLLLKYRETGKVEKLNQYHHVRLNIKKNQTGIINALNEGRIKTNEYLITKNEINRYHTLYILKGFVPAFDELVESIPEDLKTPELKDILTDIKIDIDTLGISMMSVLNVDGDLPAISDFNEADSISLAENVFEITGSGEERLRNAGIENFFNSVNANFLNFETALDRLLSNRTDVFLSKSDLDILAYFIVSMSVIFLLFIYLLRRSIRLAISNSAHVLESISKGELVENLEKRDDEFHAIDENSNKLIDYLKDSSDFASKIGEGDFHEEFSPKSDQDILGNALLNMRNRLMAVAKEDKIRNWKNEGQTKFGNILRQYGDNIKELGDHLISALVEYTGAAQGGLFVVNNEGEQQYLELLSAYAYGRKKHEIRKIEPGEGLAGQVFLERKEVYFTSINEKHFYIQSGMGTSKPASVLIVPLMDEDHIEGVLEIASLQEMDQDQIDFVKRVGENIASSLRVGKINHTTRRLLEETSQKAEEMKAQEEELRQNMEELAATQEQMERLRKDEGKMRQEIEDRQKMMIDILNKIPEKVFVKDKDGKLILLNQAVADVYGKTIEELLGTTDFDFFSREEAQEFREAELKVIEKGEIYYNPEEKFKDKEGNIRILQSKKIPFHISYMDQTGLLGVQLDVTEVQQMEDELKKKETRLEEIEKKLQEEMGRASGK